MSDIFTTIMVAVVTNGTVLGLFLLEHSNYASNSHERGQRVLHSMNPHYNDADLSDGCETRGLVVVSIRKGRRP